MRFTSVLFLVGLCFAFLTPCHAFAADPQSVHTESTESDDNIAPVRPRASLGSRSIHTDYMVGDLDEDEHGDGYIKPTYERLSQLYWALAMMDMEDKEAIDGYLKLHECDLYKQFYSRDFELEELRAVTRDSIMRNLAGFPTQFEIFMPVGLDRYNRETGVFLIADGSKFIEAKKLEVSRNTRYRSICGESVIPKYPRNFILYFNRPFSLTKIPMSPDTAREIIDFADEDRKKGIKGKYYEFRYLSEFGRIVFLRIQVTMTQYKEMSRNYSDEWVPIIFATIDGYQIFSDKERMHMIYDRELEIKRKMKKLKDAADGNTKNIVLPEGPLLKESEFER